MAISGRYGALYSTTDASSSRSISVELPSSRKTSSSSTASTASPTISSPRVQLIPYARAGSFDASFSLSERELLDKTSFDVYDLSSKDFDFEDIFTYDKPQKKLSSVVEVSTHTRDWSNFSFSHYTAATTTRNKVNQHLLRQKSATGETSVRPKSVVRKR